MRKSSAVLIVLFLIGAGWFGFISRGMKAEENRVQFVTAQETGAVQAADGLEVSMEVSIENLANWDIQSTFRDGIQTESTFSFGKGRKKSVAETMNDYFYREIYLSSFDGGGVTGGDILSEQSTYGWYSPYLSIFQELADKIQKNGQQEFMVKLKDYLEYYPVCIDSDYSETIVTNGHEKRAITMLDIKKETCADISSILQIPVLDEFQMQIFMQKNGNTVYDMTYDINTFIGDREISPHVNGCVTYDGMLIAADYRLSAGDGVKVVWIPFVQSESATASLQEEPGKEKKAPVFCPDYQAAKVVYEETARQISVDFLTATEDGREFVMMYQVDGMGRVMRLGSKNGEILQNDVSGLKECSTYFQDGDAVIGIADQIAVLEKDTKGDYQTILLVDDQTDGGSLLDPEFAWDGARLAVTEAAAGYEGVYSYSYGPSFKLYVYGKEGLLYKGVYQCTLDDIHFSDQYDGDVCVENSKIMWK